MENDIEDLIKISVLGAEPTQNTSFSTRKISTHFTPHRINTQRNLSNSNLQMKLLGHVKCASWQPTHSGNNSDLSRSLNAGIGYQMLPYLAYAIKSHLSFQFGILGMNAVMKVWTMLAMMWMLFVFLVEGACNTKLVVVCFL